MSTMVLTEPTQNEQKMAFKLEYREWTRGKEKDYLLSRKNNLQHHPSKKLYVMKQDNMVIGSLLLHELTIGKWKGVGISAVVVHPSKRNQGYGKKMLEQVFHQYPESDFFLLYSEIGEEFYQKLDFNSLPKGLQWYDDLLAMIRCSDKVFEEITTIHKSVIPLFFN